MLTAFEREMKLMPHIQAMDSQGVCIDVPLLAHDLNEAYNELDWLDKEIDHILGRSVDVDSNDDLANAIEEAGLSKGFGSTASGKRSVAKDSLLEAVSDKTLLGHLLVRNSLATCIRTFMQPWLEQAKATGGLLFIKWNQVRNYSDTGARTGRLSSSPNLQNVPDEWEKLQSQLDSIGYTLHAPMPRVRKYIVARPGHVLIGRDYQAQEMRLLAHFAGGALLESLQKDPTRDIHLLAAEIAGITRKVAKTLGFAVLYGAGVGRIAESLYISTDEAQHIKNQYLAAMPEIKILQSELSYRGRNGLPIRTLGGRHYMCEPPKEVAGRWRTFEYKLTNYLIQGSAADQTKEAMLRYALTTSYGWLRLSVHDQIVVEVPEAALAREQKYLQEAVDGAFQDVLDYTVISTEAIGHSYADLH